MPPYQQMTASEILDLYFIENRARLLDIASFLDRIDRYEGAAEARQDFRYQAFVKALGLLGNEGQGRTEAIQSSFSDPTSEPLTSAVGLKAFGAWDGGKR
ncbi:hypothetical protein OR1_02297 [Geobacter sp. OR-1]|uniref:hypothetical protein n=1 Tax=Geobacter sp. OR-1 TaxID=1266765 RepID=UPI000541A26E|nr:hypothetical protein [Geobacter sp. OR-1]GAM10012.1 hypothetical protein OR1_02297 [Geobacter sp. OR-1]